MPLYRYEALDRTGNKVVGAMQVDSEQTLSTRLATMGYEPTLVQVSPRALTHAPAPKAATAKTETLGSRLSASERDVARVTHQLFLALKAGMPVYQSLTTVAGQVSSPALRQALMEMAQGIQSGGTLSAVMERYPRIFGPGDVGMVRAAELGGFLPEALQAVSARVEEEDNARGRMRIWTWFLHSNAVSLFFFIPVGFFLRDVFPSFDMKVGLASAMRSLITLTLPLCAAYLAGVFALSRMRLNPGFRRRWHGLMLKLPITGKIAQVRAKAVFTRVLAWLVHAGVSPAAAWEAAAGAVPNLALAERFGLGTAVIQSAGRPSAAIQATNVLDPADAGLVATGETTGEIAQALNFLAARYEEEASRTVQESASQASGLFRAWAILIGFLGFALVMWGYAQGAVKIGTEEGF